MTGAHFYKGTAAVVFHKGTPNFNQSQFQTLKLWFKVVSSLVNCILCKKEKEKRRRHTLLKMFCSKKVIAGCS